MVRPQVKFPFSVGLPANTGENRSGEKRMAVFVDLVIIVILTMVDSKTCQYIPEF